MVDGSSRSFQTLESQAYVIAQCDCEEYSIRYQRTQLGPAAEGLELVRIEDLEPFIMGYFNLFESPD